MFKVLKSIQGATKVGKMRRQHTIPSDATADISGAMGSVDVPYDTLHAMPSDLRRGSSRVDTESSAGVTATSGYEDMDTIEDVIVSFNAQYGLDGAVEKTQTKEAGIHHIHNRIPELARAGESHSPRYMRAASLDKEGALIKPVQSGTLAPNNQPTPARDTIPIAKPRPAPRPLRKHVTQGAVETKPGAHLHVASPDSPKHRRNSSARPRGGSGNPISPVGGRRLPDLPLARACSNDPHTHIDAHSHISVSSSLHQSVGIASLKSRGRPTPVLPKATSADISRIGNTECRTYIDGETIEHSTCFQYFDTTLSRSHKRRVMDTLMKPEDTGAWFIRHDTSGCRYILVIKLVERLLHIPIESPPDMASFSIDEGLSFGTIEELLQYYHHNNLSSSVPLPLKAPVGEPKIALRAGEEAEVDGYLVMARS